MSPSRSSSASFSPVDAPDEQEKFFNGNSAAPTETETENAASEKPKEEPKEEVRAVLAEKSRAGKTAEVKGLLTKFGVNKLSELDASKYDELLKETEGI